MGSLVVLNLGQGDCQSGLPNIAVRLWLDHAPGAIKWVGQLPPAPELADVYHLWRSLYEALHYRLHWRSHEYRVSPIALAQPEPTGCGAVPFRSFEFEPDAVTNVSVTEFEQLCRQLHTSLNQWLNSSGFANIDRQLRTKLSPTDSIRVIIETDDYLLQALPWHLWTFFDDYPKAEVALSTQEYDQVAPITTPSQTIRILAVLGHSGGIDVQHDRALLDQLPDAEVVVLSEPQRSELDQWLWNQQGWDVLFFAGHSASQSTNQDGQLFINPTEQISIAHLKNALRAAISRGLKLAIFNSCDGLGLGRALADLNIPQLVVMREPIADRVAQEFLKTFLQVFAQGETFYQSVRQARERLQGLEGEFPCASWLPVIYQNPTEVPIKWSSLLRQNDLSSHAATGSDISEKMPSELGDRQTASRCVSLCHSLLVSFSTTVLVMGLRFLGVLQASELIVYDQLMRSRAPNLEPAADPHLLVVEITQEDTHQYGYPVKDIYLAEALDVLQRYQPRAIGIDLHRYQANEPGREQLISQFQQHTNLFTVCSSAPNRPIYGSPPEFSDEQTINQVGFSDFLVDHSAYNQHRFVRRHLLSYDPRLSSGLSRCATPFSLSFHLAYSFLYDEGKSLVSEKGEWQSKRVVFSQLASRTGGYQNLDGQSDQILLNYRFNDKPAQRITLRDILSGSVDPDWISNRIILMGTIDPLGEDEFDTPYGKLPGVWIHAHMVSQLVHAVLHERSLIWVLPQQGNLQWGDFLFVWTWSALGGFIVWRFRSLIVVGLVGGVAILGLYHLCLFILIKGGWMPLFPSVLSFVITTVALVIYLNSQIQLPFSSFLETKEQ